MYKLGDSVPIESLEDGEYELIAVALLHFTVHSDGEMAGRPIKGVFVLRPHVSHDCITVHFKTADVLPQINTDAYPGLFPAGMLATLSGNYLNFSKTGARVDITIAGANHIAGFTI